MFVTHSYTTQFSSLTNQFLDKPIVSGYEPVAFAFEPHFFFDNQSKIIPSVCSTPPKICVKMINIPLKVSLVAPGVVVVYNVTILLVAVCLINEGDNVF